MRILEKLRIVFSVAAVDEKTIDLSLASTFKDFEDAVLIVSSPGTKLITGWTVFPS